jgi:hypothetical protein
MEFMFILESMDALLEAIPYLTARRGRGCPPAGSQTASGVKGGDGTGKISEKLYPIPQIS